MNSTVASSDHIVFPIQIQRINGTDRIGHFRFRRAEALHLTNTRTLMILISAVSVYNIIVTRSFMENTIPEELRDAAKVDGCGDGYFFFKIVMPLSKAIMGVLVLFLAVSYWNSYFNPMIFLTDRSKYPLSWNWLVRISSHIRSSSLFG